MQIMKKKQKTKDYNFDIKGECAKYVNVGMKDGDFETYTQWEVHIKSVIGQYSPLDLKNFQHYLIKEKRTQEDLINNLDSIWMPLNIFVSTVFMTFVFAYAELVSDLFTETEKVVSDFLTKEQASFYADTLDKLVHNFNTSVWIYGGMTFLVLGLGIGIYITGRVWRKSMSNQRNFFEDMLSIIAESNRIDESEDAVDK